MFMAERNRYFDAVHKAIQSMAFIEVRRSPTKRNGYHQPHFFQDNKLISLPSQSGIYLIYRKNNDVPFYCGEADNLKNRVTFHFKDCPSVRNFSTLKKALPDECRDLFWMSENLRLRIVDIPFGRNDVEEYLHKEYGINTKKNRASGCMVS